MKRLPMMLMAITMAFATSAMASDDEAEWSPNLLQKSNGEAEVSDEWGIWQGNFTRLSSYGSVFPHMGNFFFRLSGTVKLTQNIDVSEYAPLIDKGEAEAKLGGWFLLGGGTPDCSFITQYYDENGEYLTEDSKTVACDTAKWTEQQTLTTLPASTRSVTFEIRVIVPSKCQGGSYWEVFTKKYCDVLLDDAYFQIDLSAMPDETSVENDQETSNDKDNTSAEEGESDDDSGDSPDETSATATTANLHFTDVEPLYQVGDLVMIDLVENLQVATRFHRVDLWVAIELPDGNLLFMTENPFESFSLKPQPFKSSLDTSQSSHRVLEFEVIPNLLGGTYTFYAVYVKEGKNPMNSFLVLRSNIAMAKVVLSNDS
jgi:hypothetical protein